MRYVSACNPDPAPAGRARPVLCKKQPTHHPNDRNGQGGARGRDGRGADRQEADGPSLGLGEGDVSELPRNGCHWTCAY